MSGKSSRRRRKAAAQATEPQSKVDDLHAVGQEEFERHFAGEPQGYWDSQNRLAAICAGMACCVTAACTCDHKATEMVIAAISSAAAIPPCGGADSEEDYHGYITEARNLVMDAVIEAGEGCDAKTAMGSAAGEAAAAVVYAYYAGYMEGYADAASGAVPAAPMWSA